MPHIGLNSLPVLSRFSLIAFLRPGRCYCPILPRGEEGGAKEDGGDGGNKCSRVRCMARK